MNDPAAHNNAPASVTPDDVNQLREKLLEVSVMAFIWMEQHRNILSEGTSVYVSVTKLLLPI